MKAAAVSRLKCEAIYEITVQILMKYSNERGLKMRMSLIKGNQHIVISHTKACQLRYNLKCICKPSHYHTFWVGKPPVFYTVRAVMKTSSNIHLFEVLFSQKWEKCEFGLKSVFTFFIQNGQTFSFSVVNVKRRIFV